MKYDPEIHHRRSIRLRGYDYAQPGMYFITLCSFNKECAFGRIAEGQIHLNAYGKIVHEEWFRSANLREEIRLEAFVVMPNHVHSIIEMVGATRRVAPTERRAATNRPRGPKSRSIGAIISQIKCVTMKRINQIRGTPVEPVWQRNYYEHIIRNEGELNTIREYLATNPWRRMSDPENPDFTPDP